MAQANILDLAKQGNPKAIAALINRQLQPKGITAKAALKDSCLQVMLEATQVPGQKDSVAFIRKGITNLKAPSIEKVKVYGKQVGEEFPAWSEEFELIEQIRPGTSTSSFSSTSRQGNQGASSINNRVASPDESKLQSQNLAYGAFGSNGQIRLTRNRVIISRKGFWGFMSQGLSGDKEIPINRITAVQFKLPDNLTKGYLQLSIQGGIESRGGVFNAANDENTVLFESDHQADFEEIKRYIDSVIDGEPIDFSTLQLATPEVAEQKRVQVQAKSVENFSKSVNNINDLKISDASFEVVLLWLTGIILGIGGASLLNNLLIVPGLALLLATIIIIPPSSRFLTNEIKKGINFNFSPIYKAISVGFLLFIAIVSA